MLQAGTSNLVVSDVKTECGARGHVTKVKVFELSG